MAYPWPCCCCCCNGWRRVLLCLITDLFSAVFFVSVGMLIDPAMLLKYATPIVLVTLVIILGKIIFTVLGVWLALKLIKPKVETRIVEKEIYIHQTTPTEINQQEIEQLGISKRELEVLDLMARGMSNEEIAAALFVSLNTVKTHSSGIFVKLDVKRRTQAVEKAKRLRIIQ